jgi:hypothetical protein
MGLRTPKRRKIGGCPLSVSGIYRIFSKGQNGFSQDLTEARSKHAILSRIDTVEYASIWSRAVWAQRLGFDSQSVDLEPARREGNLAGSRAIYYSEVSHASSMDVSASYGLFSVPSG